LPPDDLRLFFLETRSFDPRRDQGFLQLVTGKAAKVMEVIALLLFGGVAVLIWRGCAKLAVNGPKWAAKRRWEKQMKHIHKEVAKQDPPLTDEQKLEGYKKEYDRKCKMIESLPFEESEKENQKRQAARVLKWHVSKLLGEVPEP
jgi:hypothetical protein